MDIDDDLLALAEGTSSKRSKSSKSKGTKRKRPSQTVLAPEYALLVVRPRKELG